MRRRKKLNPQRPTTSDSETPDKNDRLALWQLPLVFLVLGIFFKEAFKGMKSGEISISGWEYTNEAAWWAGCAFLLAGSGLSLFFLTQMLQTWPKQAQRMGAEGLLCSVVALNRCGHFFVFLGWVAYLKAHSLIGEDLTPVIGFALLNLLLNLGLSRVINWFKAKRNPLTLNS